MPGELQRVPIGVVTLLPEQIPEESRPGDWRLRGMAVDPAYQGSGVGRQLILACHVNVRMSQGKRIWCNARVAAEGFYKACGFESLGQRFEIEGIGPHIRMLIAVGRPCR